ncbi:MAG TPA: ABC transporter permease [Nitrososphaeraceae archaeon]|nr:ABC transporter permease [Nitrososphaeraceae archaeon]
MEINKRWIELGLGKLYAIWLREFQVFLREKSRLIASTFTPLLWLFVIGEGFGSTTDLFGSSSYVADTYVGYQQFIFPGIICMSVIFTSVFFGSYIIWDRKFDFLKSVMVAPVSRTTIFLGKAFGGMTTSLIQAAILLVVGFVIGIHYTPLSMVLIITIILLLSFTLTSLGLTLGSRMESLEGFQLIVSFVVFPLYFLSGALFPLNNLPTWLSILTTIDPVTYGVNALREVMLGITGVNSFALNIGILLLAATSLGTIGVISFRIMKAV